MKNISFIFLISTFNIESIILNKISFLNTNTIGLINAHTGIKFSASSLTIVNYSINMDLNLTTPLMFIDEI